MYKTFLIKKLERLKHALSIILCFSDKPSSVTPGSSYIMTGRGPRCGLTGLLAPGLVN